MVESQKDPSETLWTSPTTTQDQKCPEGSESLALKEHKGKEFSCGLLWQKNYSSHPITQHRIVHVDICIYCLEFVIRNGLNLCCYIILLKGTSFAPGFKNYKVFTHFHTPHNFSDSFLQPYEKGRQNREAFPGMKLRTGSAEVAAMSSGSSRWLPCLSQEWKDPFTPQPQWKLPGRWAQCFVGNEPKKGKKLPLFH